MKNLTKQQITELLDHHRSELADCEEKFKRRTEQILKAESAELTHRYKEGADVWVNEMITLRTFIQELRDELNRKEAALVAVLDNH